MALPDNPQSRSEQYLNAIATGNNSGLPSFPQSREEQYLDCIAKNGGGSSGGGVLVVNIIDGDENSTLDKTWQEIYDALAAMPVVVVYSNSIDGYTDQFYVYHAHKGMGAAAEKGYLKIYSFEDGVTTAVAATANDYPVIVWE